MASNKSVNNSSNHTSHNQDPEFWRQLSRDFSFEGVDEEQLRQQTEQWINCANELLGPLPSQMKNKTKR